MLHIADVQDEFLKVAKKLFQKVTQPTWSEEEKTHWSNGTELVEYFKVSAFFIKHFAKSNID